MDKAMPIIPPGWTSISLAARQAEVTTQAIDKAIRRGEIRTVQTPLGRLLDPDDVRRYAKARNARGRLSTVAQPA